MTAQVVEHTYRPRGACAGILTARQPEVLISGPAGTGKSRACLEKICAMCLLNPGMRALIVRKTATSLKTTADKTWREHVANELLLAGEVTYKVADSRYDFRNGSTVQLGGMDKASRIMSSEYDIIYIQEATELSEDDWEHLTTRLRNGRVSFQQLIADCNPSAPTHWLKARCDTKSTVLLESRHEDNPVLVDPNGKLTTKGSSYLSVLDALTGVRYQRLRKGKWAAAEGLIYEDFDSTIHLIDCMPDGWESWPRYWGVDFGFTNPFVCQFWAEDPDGRLYLYRELYQTKRTVDGHAAVILDAVAPVQTEGSSRSGRTWTEPRPRAVVCDHDAEGRAVLERELELSTVPAHKAVSEGIQAVQVRLKPAGDGRPRLFILRGALLRRDNELAEAKKPTCTEEELPGYIWAVKPGTGGATAKEVPVKEDDHGMDAMRYVVAHRDLRGGGYGGRVLRL